MAVVQHLSQDNKETSLRFIQGIIITLISYRRLFVEYLSKDTQLISFGFIHEIIFTLTDHQNRFVQYLQKWFQGQINCMLSGYCFDTSRGQNNSTIQSQIIPSNNYKLQPLFCLSDNDQKRGLTQIIRIKQFKRLQNDSRPKILLDELSINDRPT